MAEGEKGLWRLFHKGINLIHDGSALVMELLHVSPSNPIAFGTRFPQMNLGETQIFTYSSQIYNFSISPQPEILSASH